MAALKAAQGAGFQAMWLEMMVYQHKGASRWRRPNSLRDKVARALELAENIESGQRDEVRP